MPGHAWAHFVKIFGLVAFLYWSSVCIHKINEFTWFHNSAWEQNWLRAFPAITKGIIKSDVSNHFPIFFSIQLNKEKLWKVYKIKKIVFNNRNITPFKEQLPLLHWRHIDFNGTVNEIYDTFLKTLTDIYDANFPIREYLLKIKDIKYLRIIKQTLNGLGKLWKK